LIKSEARKLSVELPQLAAAVAATFGGGGSAIEHIIIIDIITIECLG
jgi:hypothetical protein